ncbi:phosphate import ATP-binding protein pstB [Striga asiatica]|uniref:Phosphate import ATP-binding protein pstB n=1 Tax=Striga asiatica TaxID=4170 RepID=A0A5A7NXT9_STRAF|nr:phosphate import ATP-binding protein pstB [Striga asiatica]
MEKLFPRRTSAADSHRRHFRQRVRPTAQSSQAQWRTSSAADSQQCLSRHHCRRHFRRGLSLAILLTPYVPNRRSEFRHSYYVKRAVNADELAPNGRCRRGSKNQRHFCPTPPHKTQHAVRSIYSRLCHHLLCRTNLRRAHIHTTAAGRGGGDENRVGCARATAFQPPVLPLPAAGAARLVYSGKAALVGVSSVCCSLVAPPTAAMWLKYRP